VSDPGKSAQLDLPDPSRAARIIAEGNLHLADVRLLELNASFAPFAHIPEAPYTFTVQVGFSFARRDDGFSYAIRADVGAYPLDQSEGTPFWSCTAAYDLNYTINDPGRFDDDEAVAFGMTSGVFAAWPYLRHQVQSISAQARLNPILLDVMTVLGGVPPVPGGPKSDS
jgi:hypothetical protein